MEIRVSWMTVFINKKTFQSWSAGSQLFAQLLCRALVWLSIIFFMNEAKRRVSHEQNWAINESSNVELLLSIYAHSRPDHSGAVFNQTNSTSYNYQMKNPKLLVGVRRAIDSILPRPEILTSQWKLFYCLWNDVQVLMTTIVAAAAITKTTKNKFASTSQCKFSCLFSLSKSKLLGSREMDIRVARRWSLFVINRVIAMTTLDNLTEFRVLVLNVSLSRQTRRRNENNKKKLFHVIVAVYVESSKQCLCVSSNRLLRFAKLRFLRSPTARFKIARKQ